MKPLSELKHLLPENPPGTPEGHYWTMNNMGTCEDFLDELTQAFVDYSKEKDVIDIGCGYGTAIIAALENGAKTGFACDIDEKNLSIAGRRTHKQGLVLIKGDIVTEPIERIGERIFIDTFDAVLLNKVLHVLNSFCVITALINARSLLKAGGKIFIKCVSPFSKIFTSDFHKAAEEFEVIFPSQNVPLAMQEIFKEKIPGVVSVFTTRKLESLLKYTGYEIEVCKYIPAHIESMRGDLGKDYVMAIARK